MANKKGQVMKRQASPKLECIPFFAGIDESSLRQIAAKCQKLSFFQNFTEVMFDEEAPCIFLVISGYTMVYRRGITGHGKNPGTKIVVDICRPGEFAGDSGLAGEPWNFYLTAVRDTCLLKIGSQNFQEILAENVELSKRHQACLDQKNRDLMERRICREGAPIGRVRQALEYLNLSPDSIAPFRQHHLAAFVGLGRETFARYLGELIGLAEAEVEQL